MIRIKNPIAPRLPSEFQEVEYIESTGTQYIDTEVLSKTGIKVKTYTQLTSLNTGQYLFGARVAAASQRNDLMLYYNSNYGRYEMYYYYSNNGYNFFTDVNSFFSAKNIYETIDGKLLVNGATLIEKTGTAFTSSLNTFIFCTNNNGTPTGYTSMKLYYFKLYDNGILIRDYIPCYRKTDNVAGLYDLVNDVFYSNAGTGVFLRGNEINKRDLNIKPVLGNKPLIRRYVGDKIVYNSGEIIPDFTKLLMHFENNLSDSTGLNTPTVYGTEKYGSGKIGNAFVFNGSSAIKIPYNSNIVFGANDFTIAGWFYLPTQTIGYSCLFSHKYRVDSTYRYSGFSVGFDKTSRKLFFQVYTTYSAQFSKWGSVDIPVNQWLHIAFVRSGDNFTLYVDGKEYLSATNSSSLYQHTSASFKIGSATNESTSNDNPQAMLTSGSMVDEFIIVNGSALWTGEFTPPERQYE